MVGNMPSINRNIKNTKVTEEQLYRLERKVCKKRHLSASRLRYKSQISASVRTVQKILEFTR